VSTCICQLVYFFAELLKRCKWHLSKYFFRTAGEYESEKSRLNFGSQLLAGIDCMFLSLHGGEGMRFIEYPLVLKYREPKYADTIGRVLVPWAGHFQC